MWIGICDDEKEMRRLLGEKVRKYCPQAELSFYEDGEALLRADEWPQILLLDIQMPGSDGMETARRLRNHNRNMILIFVTALEEYVFQAFDVGAFHYLVKPFSDTKLKEVLSAAAAQYREMEALQRAARDQGENSILVKSGGCHTRIFQKDIIYAEVFNRKVTIHSREGDIEYYGRLGELEQQLGEDFYRSHRAYLIHFRYVEKYTSSTIELERGTALMAKQNYPEFVKRYLAYNRRQGQE